MRAFMHLAYRGAPFHGWQTQPNAVSVQQTIEEALAKILRRPVAILGAGRTDAGVNARMMIAHLDLAPGELTPILARSLNTIVGPDIAIYSISEVPDGAHARFDAVERTYRYFVNHVKSPFFNALSWFSPRLLDYERMNEAAAYLLEVEDFTSFAKLHSDAKTNICDVRKAVWTPVPTPDGTYWQFEISADRFLRNMVRAIVGTLVDVGRGKLSVDGFREIVATKDRCAAGTSMPGHALYLWDVKYPYYTPPEVKTSGFFY